jgi:hypothetical protein
MLLNTISVKPDWLLLDPNNYRFHDLSGYKPIKIRGKYADVHVQEKTLSLLQTTPEFDLQALKDSISTNGFVPLEQIVVEEYDNKNGKKRYLVIEGNRRVAAIKTLLEEIRDGNTIIPKDKEKSIRAFKAYELTGSAASRISFRRVLMAIRHVSGVRPWGPYQQAKLIAELYEEGERQFGSVAEMIGSRAREVARRYRAIKALEQMEQDDEFGEYASPELYASFQEALSAPIVKDWLGWSDKTYMMENEENKRRFYELVIPRTIDGQAYKPKLEDIRQVRKLKEILDSPEATTILLDAERSLEDAITVAIKDKNKNTSGSLQDSIEQALDALNQPGITAWLHPTESERKVWEKLVSFIDEINSMLNKV